MSMRRNDSRPIQRLFLPIAVSAALLMADPSLAGGPAFTRLFAVADDAQTSYLNPAGMVRLEQSAFTGQIIYGQTFQSFQTDQGLTTVDGGDPRDQDPVIVPSLYYVRPIFNDDWRLGLTLNVPGGFGAGNGPNWAGRYYSDQFSLVFVAATATLARRITPWLSVGGGVSVQYTDTESTTQVRNPNNDPDGRLEVTADGIAPGYVASLLIDFSPRTRFGVAWHSETDPEEDVEVDLVNSTLLPDDIVIVTDGGDGIDTTLRTPQHVDFGLYHEWSNGWSATVDAIWVEFSRFGLQEFAVNDNELDVPDSNFKDFWIYTAGFEYPMAKNMRGRMGVFYLEQPVSNEDRTFSFALDNAWGIGSGFSYTRDNGHVIDFSLTGISVDNAPVDTGPLSALEPRGRVVGQNNDRWSMAIEFTYHMGHAGR